MFYVQPFCFFCGLCLMVYIYLSLTAPLIPFRLTEIISVEGLAGMTILIFGRCTKSFQWMSKHLFAYWSISYPTFKLTIFPLTHHCLWHAHKRKLDGIYLRHFEFSGCFVSYTFKFECLYFKEVDNNRCELSCPGQSTWWESRILEFETDLTLLAYNLWVF